MDIAPEIKVSTLSVLLSKTYISGVAPSETVVSESGIISPPGVNNSRVDVLSIQREVAVDPVIALSTNIIIPVTWPVSGRMSGIILVFNLSF